MPVRRVYGNPLVRHVAGKVAIQRGPLVYCSEQADNGESLHNLWLPTDAPFTTFEGKGLFSHKILIRAPGYRYEQKAIQSSNRCGITTARQPNARRKL